MELNKTAWEVPERYQSLSPVGSGAYGQVSFSLVIGNDRLTREDRGVFARMAYEMKILACLDIFYRQ